MYYLHRMGDFMKCEYCGFEFNAPHCPNCGAFAPDYQVQPPFSDINKHQNRNDDYLRRPHPEVYNHYYTGVKIRSIASCIILTLITCGLYSLIWASNLNDESNYLSEEPKPTSGTAAVLLILLTCGIYYFFWAYKQGERIDRARSIRGMTPANMGIAYALLLLLPYAGLFISLSMMQNEINNLAV